MRGCSPSCGAHGATGSSIFRSVWRLVAPCAVPTSTNVVICELHRTWRRPEAAEIAEIYTVATPNYRAVMESYQNAKRVGSSDKQAA